MNAYVPHEHYSKGDCVVIDSTWIVKGSKTIKANASGIGMYDYRIYTISNGTVSIDVPEWLILGKLEDDV